MRVSAPASAGLPTLTVVGSLFAGEDKALFANPAIVSSYVPVGFTASSTWLGVPDAFVFSVNAGGTVARLEIPRVGFSLVLTAPSFSQLPGVIAAHDTTAEDAAITLLAKELLKISVLSTSDGNPNASTAQAAGSIFSTEGFQPADTLATEAEATSAGQPAPKRPMNFNLGFNAGRFRAGGFSGSKIDFAGSLPLLTAQENVSLLAGGAVSQVMLDGGRSQSATLNFTLPIRLVSMDRDRKFTWRVIPFAGVTYDHSDEFDTNGLLWQAGVVDSIDYRAGPKLVLSLVNQASVHRSSGRGWFGDQMDDLAIDQQILKNGIRAVTPLSRRFVGEVFVIGTNFLSDAAVKYFTTIGGSISWRATTRYNLALGLNYDTGRSFSARSVGLSSAWHW